MSSTPEPDLHQKGNGWGNRTPAPVRSTPRPASHPAPTAAYARQSVLMRIAGQITASTTAQSTSGTGADPARASTARTWKAGGQNAPRSPACAYAKWQVHLAKRPPRQRWSRQQHQQPQRQPFRREAGHNPANTAPHPKSRVIVGDRAVGDDPRARILRNSASRSKLRKPPGLQAPPPAARTPLDAAHTRAASTNAAGHKAKPPRGHRAPRFQREGQRIRWPSRPLCRQV